MATETVTLHIPKILYKRLVNTAHAQNRPIEEGLQVEEQLIGFYREDTGEKLLIPGELKAALESEKIQRQQAESQVERLKEKLREFGVDPDAI